MARERAGLDGPGGAYDPATGGAWKDPAAVKGTVAPYPEEFVDCLATIAQYVYEKHGKFPGTRATIELPGYVQAQHIDTEFYDRYYQEGAYLTTHAQHLERWHGRSAGAEASEAEERRPMEAPRGGERNSKGR